MLRDGLIHSFCTGFRTKFHRAAIQPACAPGSPGALSKSWKAAMRDRRGQPQGKPGAGEEKPINLRGDPGARANFLAAKNAGEGATRTQAVQGVTFDAGPTRTWVRGRSTGQLGRRPLSRLGHLTIQPTIWGETIRQWPFRAPRAKVRSHAARSGRTGLGGVPHP